MGQSTSWLWWCGFQQWKWLSLWIWRRQSLESSSLTLEIWDSYTLSDWNPFWNQLKKLLPTDNYNCQISQIFLFLWAFFNTLKVTFQVTQFWSRGHKKLHFRESSFTNFPWSMPLDPPRSSCLWLPAEPLHLVLPNATENPDHRILYLDNHSA